MTARNNWYDGTPLPQKVKEVDVWVKGSDGLLQQETRNISNITSSIPFEVRDTLTRNGIDIDVE